MEKQYKFYQVGSSHRIDGRDPWCLLAISLDFNVRKCYPTTSTTTEEPCLARSGWMWVVDAVGHFGPVDLLRVIDLPFDNVIPPHPQPQKSLASQGVGGCGWLML